MIKVILLLIYLLDGELTIERTTHPSLEACNKAGAARAEQIVSNPKFDMGVFAGCITAKTTEA